MRRLWTCVTAFALATFLSVPIVAITAAPAQASCSTAGCAAPVACNTTAGACWKPTVGMRWQYQLQAARNSGGTACLYPSTGGINVNIAGPPAGGGANVKPQVFDIDYQTDGFCTGGTITQENAAAVAAIHANGAHAICYVDAGTAESFRPDYQDYVTFNNAHGGALFGKPVGGFRNEFWLNINNNVGQRDFILSEVAKRVDRCKADGFDAVEFDNVDAYQNRTGLTISADTQLLFNTALANLAHSKGLTVGLKNDVGQVGDLQPYFDFAINEQCQQYNECTTLDAFLSAGKAVFQVEYKLSTSKFCSKAVTAGRGAILKTFDLFDLPWTPCA